MNKVLKAAHSGPSPTAAQAAERLARRVRAGKALPERFSRNLEFLTCMAPTERTLRLLSVRWGYC